MNNSVLWNKERLMNKKAYLCWYAMWATYCFLAHFLPQALYRLYTHKMHPAKQKPCFFFLHERRGQRLSIARAHRLIREKKIDLNEQMLRIPTLAEAKQNCQYIKIMLGNTSAALLRRNDVYIWVYDRKYKSHFGYCPFTDKLLATDTAFKNPHQSDTEADVQRESTSFESWSPRYFFLLALGYE